MSVDDTGKSPKGDEICNELEQSLAGVMEGTVSKEEFLKLFLNSNLYILLDGEPVGGVLGDRVPMVFAPSAESERMIAVFSSPLRTAAMTAKFAEYQFPVLVDTAWVLNHVGPTTGIALNPGCALGFEMASSGAQQLKKALDASSELNN